MFEKFESKLLIDNDIVIVFLLVYVNDGIVFKFGIEFDLREKKNVGFIVRVDILFVR